jgi:hypothetical protein
VADLVPDETPTDAPHEAQTTADIHALIPIETGTIGTQQGILTVDGRKVWEGALGDSYSPQVTSL